MLAKSYDENLKRNRGLLFKVILNTEAQGHRVIETQRRRETESLKHRDTEWVLVFGEIGEVYKIGFIL